MVRTRLHNLLAMKPFFTVIMCTYNRANLLPRAVGSLQAQTERDWELVIVDDASTDATPQIVAELMREDARIRSVRHDENHGTAAARNTGIAAARGLFVTFLDSDDEYASDHLATRKQMLVENDQVLFLHGGVEVIGDPWVVDKDDPSAKIHVDNCVVGGTFVIRRDVVQALGPFPEGVYGDDAEYHARAVKAGLTIARTDHPSYRYYRNVPGQVTSTHGS